MSKKVLVYFKKEKVYTPFIRDVFWYDDFYGIMKSFKCSDIEYKRVLEEYSIKEDGKKYPYEELLPDEQLYYTKHQTYRMKAFPVYYNSHRYSYEYKKQDVFSRVDKYKNNFDISVEYDDRCVLSVEERVFSEFLDALYRNKLRYEVL